MTLEERVQFLETRVALLEAKLNTYRPYPVYPTNPYSPFGIPWCTISSVKE